MCRWTTRAEIRQRPRESGLVGGVGGGQLPVEGDGLRGGRRRVVGAAQPAVAGAEIAQRRGEAGQISGVGGGQLPVEGDGLRGGRQRVVGPAQPPAVAGAE